MTDPSKELPLYASLEDRILGIQQRKMTPGEETDSNFFNEQLRARFEQAFADALQTPSPGDVPALPKK